MGSEIPRINATDFGYTGQRSLNDMGLMDYRARFYDPTIGRFIQPDTIIPSYANPQALNRFSYVQNRPILFNDPTGHRADCGTGFDGCRYPTTVVPPKRLKVKGEVHTGSKADPSLCQPGTGCKFETGYPPLYEIDLGAVYVRATAQASATLYDQTDPLLTVTQDGIGSDVFSAKYAGAYEVSQTIISVTAPPNEYELSVATGASPMNDVHVSISQSWSFTTAKYKTAGSADMQMGGRPVQTLLVVVSVLTGRSVVFPKPGPSWIPQRQW